MRNALGVIIVGACLLLGCQAPDILLSSRKTVSVQSDSYARLWQACRAVIARQYDIVQENERDGTILARGKSSGMVARPNSDPADSRTVTTEVSVAILSNEGRYEPRVRAITRSVSGPDFNVIHDTNMPQTKQRLDFNSLGTTADRDYPLEEQLLSQIQSELGYAPAPSTPKK